MNRRQFTKQGVLTVGAAALAGPAILTQIACGTTKTLAKWTGVGMEILSQMSPILTDMGATGVVGLVARALPVMSQLKKAFEDNDNASAFDLFNNLTNPQTGIIAELSNALNILQGPKRTILLGLMASANLMLRLIAANIEDSVPPSAVATAKAAKPQAANSVLNAAKDEVLERAFMVSRF